MNMPQQSWSEQGHALAPLPLTLVCGINKASFLSAATESRDANPTKSPMSFVPGSENCAYNFVILQLPRSDRCQRMTRLLPPQNTVSWEKSVWGTLYWGLGRETPEEEKSHYNVWLSCAAMPLVMAVISEFRLQPPRNSRMRSAARIA